MLKDEYIRMELVTTDDADFSIPHNRESVDQYVQQLIRIKEKLERVGKHLAFYITPPKGQCAVDDFPLRYQIQERITTGEIQGIDYLQQVLEETGFAYFVAQKFVKSHTEIPAFYPAGIHLSQALEDLVLAEQVKQMEQVFGKI